MSIKKATAIALTVDVEGEWLELPGEQGSFNPNKVLEATLHLEMLLDRIETRIGAKIPITWFIRCDDSVATATGEASGLLQSLDSFILRRTDKGDEFGLHPHLYRLSQGKWTSEMNLVRQADQVERAAKAWERYFGSVPKLSRMGEAMMNNTLATCLSELGIEIDSSALPGRRRFDNGFQFDWIGTPISPYYPSVLDYRRRKENSEAAYSYVEIPFTMLPIMGHKDEKPIMRYCNFAFRPNLIESTTKSIIEAEHLIAVVHPHELLMNSSQHPLIAHNPAALEENIQNFNRNFRNLEFSLLSKFANDANKQY